jgi:DNA polymerase
MSLIERYITAVAQIAEQEAISDAVKRDLARAANRAIQLGSALYRFHHDFETYCDVSLPDVGADAYSRHPSLDPLMCAYACNDEEVLQWVPAEGQRMPVILRDALRDPKAVKFAWNKPFEWSIWANALGIVTPHEQWRDPMILAFSLSLPGSLAKAGEVVDLPPHLTKMKDGAALIRLFCAPQTPSKKKPFTRALPHHFPEKWETFKQYNRTDVEAERAIYRRIRKYDMPQEEWELWHIDQEINQAGIPINMNLVTNAIEVYETLIDDRITRMREITKLANPNSNEQLLKWLREFGYPFEDMKKGHISRALEKLDQQFKDGEFDEYDAQSRLELEQVREVLGMRLEVSAASPKKYYALDRATVEDGDGGSVLRNAFQFNGAGRTWRWAGRLYQAQNLPRPDKALEKGIAIHVRNLEFLRPAEIDFLYPKPIKLLQAGLRPCAQAPEGYTFIDADLSAIENRVLGWMAGCSKILRVFLENRDPYIDFATYMYGIPYDELMADYKAGLGERRQTAKPGVLGCGYMLGAGQQHYNRVTAEMEANGLLGYAWGMGITSFTPEQSKLSVETFRREFKEVVDFWYAIERAAKRCVRTGQPTSCRMINFDMKAPFLRMILPSGRALHYCRPKLEMIRAPWGELKETLTYEGLNDKNQWTRVATHPGKLTENADQAMARDLLAHGMRLAKREHGLDLRIHVHDQLVGLSRIDRAEEELKILIQCMEVNPWWAQDLPLGSNGFISPIFIKN